MYIYIYIYTYTCTHIIYVYVLEANFYREFEWLSPLGPGPTWPPVGSKGVEAVEAPKEDPTNTKMNIPILNITILLTMFIIVTIDIHNNNI